MEARSLLKPLRSLTSLTAAATSTASSSSSSCCRHLSRAARRHQSTTSRTKKALKIPPHPSFLSQSPEGANHIVFNPPASAASVYHTPFKFLPRSDPRRQAGLTQFILRNAAASASNSASATTPDGQHQHQHQHNQQLPPLLTHDELERSRPRHNVTREQVEEMRALRAQDPQRWSVLELARRYKCTNWFVMVCCKSSPEHRASERERREAIRARWGPIRTQAREERKKRKALLLRDQL